MVVFGRWDIIPQLAGNIPLIVLAFVWGLYATDPTFYGNQKQPLVDGSLFASRIC